MGAASRDVEHERAVAIYDLIEENSFAPVGHDGGPYCLALQVVENRLVFDIRTEDGDPVIAHHLSLSPFRRLVKDYFLVCESYYQAIRTATPSQIEAIDMGRRGAPQRGLGAAAGAAQGQDRGRLRHRAAAVHPAHRPALEGMRHAWPARARRRCCSPAGSIRCARRWRRRCSSTCSDASTYVGSAGVRKGELDPFAVAAMEEIGLDIAKHRPMTFEELEDLEGLNFDLIVTLAPEAHHKALDLTRTARRSTSNTGRPPDPTIAEGQPRAAARRLSRGPRPAHAPDQASASAGAADRATSRPSAPARSAA